MIQFLQLIEALFSNQYIFLTINLLSCLLKLSFFGILLRYLKIDTKKENILYYLLMIVLFSAAITDSAWIIKLIANILGMGYKFVIFWIRIAWIFFILQYQSLALFLDVLISKNRKEYEYRQILCLFISSIIILLFITIIVFYVNCNSKLDRPYFEPILQNFTSSYLLIFLMPITMYSTIKRVAQRNIPFILNKQFRFLIQSLILPYIASDFINLNPLKTNYINAITESFAVVGISTLFLTYCLYFCARRIMGLRFLNFSDHVQSLPRHTAFDAHFKNILIDLSSITHPHAISTVIERFFSNVLTIHSSKVHFFIRPAHTLKNSLITENSTQNVTYKPFPTLEYVESRLTHDQHFIAQLAHERILMYDELDFSNFYEQNNEQAELLTFLDVINADIFLPIFDKERLVAYIMIERHARWQELYTRSDRDAMIVFSSYLGTMVSMLQHKQVETLLEDNKRLSEELYQKIQHISHCKESIRSFLNTTQQKQIGIIFYKNRSFIIGNNTVTDLLGMNPAEDDGNPITKTCKKIAHLTEEYKSVQTQLIKNNHGVTLVLTAVPHNERNHVIIVVSPPDISDVIKKQIEVLHNLDEWDYVLYLQTTHAGNVINQLIPASGTTLLNFKISLLKAALSTKPLLLDVPTDDLESLSNILHHISMRQQINRLSLTEPISIIDAASRIFGVNPVYNMVLKPTILPLLAQQGSTLVISNFHLLPLETQEQLAHYVRYGFYQEFKSDTRIYSDVRIFFTIPININQALQMSVCSTYLYDQIKNNHIIMPSLLTLPEDEFLELAEGYRMQAIRNNLFQSLLSLSESDKSKLLSKRPSSLTELKDRVHYVLTRKTTPENISHQSVFDPAYSITDPELVEAARLGKQALKDPKIMALLWYKFNKNQNKMATFLGVNRSSVSRRIKEHDLT